MEALLLDAATTTMSSVSKSSSTNAMTTYVCCGCPSTNSRCLYGDQCSCKSANKFCNDSCESAKARKDCLNLELTRCQCKVVELADSNAPALAGGGRQQSFSKTPASPATCSTRACRCYQNGQLCNGTCICGGQHCGNSAGSKGKPPVQQAAAMVADHGKRLDYNGLHCKCHSGKRRCASRTKCPCRMAFKLCKTTCKCKEWCSNTNRRACISGSCKSYFLDPERGASKAMVVCLRTPDEIYYQEYLAAEKDTIHPEEMFHKDILQTLRTYTVPLTEIVVYLPTTPCFHQDCDPQCDVLDRCSSNRACAEELATAYKQVKHLTAMTNIKMQVKFLASYIRRGDLYTKQGITIMMNAGVEVEPFGMKDWIELVRQDTDSLEDATTVNEYYFSLWKGLRLTSYIRQSEIYINECRRASGLKSAYWFSCLHNLIRDCLTTTARTYSEYTRLENCLKHSKCDRHRVVTSRQANLHRTQSDSTIYNNSTTSLLCSDLQHSPRCNTSTPPPLPAMTESTERKETSPQSRSRRRKHKSVSRFSSFLRRKEKRKEYSSKETFNESLSASSAELNNLGAPHPEMFDEAAVSQLLVELYSRSIDDKQFDDVNKEIRLAVEDICDRLHKLLTYMKTTIEPTTLS